MINQERISKMKKIAKHDHVGFNCLGAVYYALGYNDDLQWDWYQELDFLIEQTEIVEGKLKKGDVLCIYDESEDFVHVAVFTGRKFFHKRGGLNAEHNTIKGIMKDYKEYGAYTYKIRRLK
jgi:hypothetical protein